MQVKNTAFTYGLVAQCLHWAVAFLILALFGLGLYMSQLTFDTEAQVAYAFSVFSLHKTLGLSVFVLAILRIVWALTQPHPHPLNSHKPIEVLAAQVVHWLLYAMIFVMPLTGYLHHSATQGLAPIWGPFPQRLGFVPQTEAVEAFWGWAHYVAAWIMGAVIALHIAGALKHVVIDQDGTLRRMTPWAREKRADVARQGFGHVPSALAAILVLAISGGVYLTGPTSQMHVGTAATASAEDLPANWSADREQSQLWIDVTQSGNPIKGQFGAWDARIFFDPATPETASLTVDIDVTSLDLGGINEQAHSASFLNSASFPSAQFVAEGFDQLGDGAFNAVGQLELMGTTLPLTLSFTLHIEGDMANAKGRATIVRHDYQIGSDDPMVGSNVDVGFEIQAIAIAK